MNATSMKRRTNFPRALPALALVCALAFAVGARAQRPRTVPRAKSPAVARPAAPVLAAHKRADARAIFQVTLTRFFQDRNVQLARGGYLEAVRQDPSYALPYFNLGVLSEAEEDWAGAISWFEEFKRRDQTSPYSAKAERELSRLRAIVESDKTPEGRRRREYDEALFRARVLFASGMLKESVDEAGSAAKIDDARWEAYALSAAVLSKLGLFDNASDFIRKAVERAPAEKRAGLEQALAEVAKEKQIYALADEAARAFGAKDYARASQTFMQAWAAAPGRDDYGLAAALSCVFSEDYKDAADILARLRGSADRSVANRAKEALDNLISKNLVPPR